LPREIGKRNFHPRFNSWSIYDLYKISFGKISWMHRIQQKIFWRALLGWWLLMTEHLITFLHLWRYQTKIMLQLAGFVVICRKMEIRGKTNLWALNCLIVVYPLWQSVTLIVGCQTGWIYLSVVIKYAKELHLMLFRLLRCCYSLFFCFGGEVHLMDYSIWWDKVV